MIQITNPPSNFLLAMLGIFEETHFLWTWASKKTKKTEKKTKQNFQKKLIKNNYLGSDDKEPTSQKRDIPAIKRFDYVDNPNSISWAKSKSTSSISKYGNEDVLFYVERTRVERKGPGPEPGYKEFVCWEHFGHEVANREGWDLDSDLGDDERLSSVGEELVEKWKEGTWEKTQEPHPEGPYG